MHVSTVCCPYREPGPELDNTGAGLEGALGIGAGPFKDV